MCHGLGNCDSDVVVFIEGACPRARLSEGSVEVNEDEGRCQMGHVLQWRGRLDRWAADDERKLPLGEGRFSERSLTMGLNTCALKPYL